jgi:EAL domain-containing protein (putative c-di-GMP-specific phosphodiesterase class I)/GGDEF domain-containing protein
MSLYRQLWLAILASALIALAASLFASLLNARSYLEAQLAMKNQDNATALALALSQTNNDRAGVALAATALFNGGHYQLIQVMGPNGENLVDKVSIHADIGAPDWFVALLPIRSLPGRAEISNGWQRLGTLTVMSASRFAYRALWRSALTMSGVMLAAGFVCALLASLILRRITRPVRAVIEQARAINDHRYITIPLPTAPEVRELARAMNDTVQRLRQDFEEDARRYEALRREANYDILTGLPNRGYFLAGLDAALDAEGAAGGYLAIVRLRKLGKLNRGLGREVADQTLRRIGAVLTALADTSPEHFAGRLNGADFALLLAGDEPPQAALESLLAELSGILDGLAGDYATVYIGYGAFSPGDAAARLLAGIDAALAGADVAGASVVRQAPPEYSGAALGGEAWRAVLRQALESPDSLKLAHFPLRLGDGRTVHRECPLRLCQVTAQGEEWLAAGRFLPIADRLGLIPALDLATLRLALGELRADDGLAGLWINLSAKSIADPAFRQALRELLEAHPEERARLWLEIPESGGLARLPALRDLSRELTPLDCKLGLEHYGHHFNQIGALHELGLDFLKVDAGFIRGIDRNPGNCAFLAGLLEIAHRIDIQVLAEGVERQEESQTLESLGFDGCSGPLLSQVRVV